MLQILCVCDPVPPRDAEDTSESGESKNCSVSSLVFALSKPHYCRAVC